MPKKSFIITVDTEGDNLWNYVRGDNVKTENALFVPRFQELCNSFALKPVWLTDYEMARDDRFVDYIGPKMENGLCEIGIHVHAWNNPPEYSLDGIYGGNPFLVEYPDDVMRQKFGCLYEMLKEKFGRSPVSHRAGRWVMDDRYFRLLEEFDIKVDCSYTPGVSWAQICGETVANGPDYGDVNKKAHMVGNVLEVPMTIRKVHLVHKGTLKHRLRVAVTGDDMWLRPATSTLDDMISLCHKVDSEEENEYLEMMVHSSELMPGGSIYFKDEESIESMYKSLGKLFESVLNLGYEGATLEDFRKLKLA